MWMIRWFLIAVALFGTILFIYENRNLDTVSINYIFGETGDLSPLLLMLLAYFAGLLTWFVISLFNFFKMRSELSSRDKLIKNLKQELNEYRSQSLALDHDAGRRPPAPSDASPAAEPAQPGPARDFEEE